MIQRFSVRATTCGETMPSGNGPGGRVEEESANGASRHEEDEIEGQPADQQQPDGDAGDDQRTGRSVAEGSRRLARIDRS
jgi:hypothetical protein